MQDREQKVICVQGPTASGKSSLAEAIAWRVSGEIISADSMQIYKGMDIGTAKVMPNERSVPYHCIDICEPGQDYSAALFQHDARCAIADIKQRGKIPIICGGTGFYVRAVIDDMDFAQGDQQSPLRKELEALYEKIGVDALYELLKQKDQESADLIHPNDVRKVIRALEMHEEGESYAARKQAFSTIPARIPSVKLALEVDRDTLYERINIRVDEMINSGLVEEVQLLLNQGFRSALTAAQAIGYKEIVTFIDNQISLDEAVSQIKQASRRYAKRQMTWLRADQEIIWLDANSGITDTLISKALDEIERANQQ